MKLYIAEKLFSIWGRYDVFHEDKSIAYVVQGQPSLLRRKLSVMDARGNEAGMIQTKVIRLLPAYTVWKNGCEIGRVQRKLALFRPKFDLAFRNWHVEGNIPGWNYKVYDSSGRVVAAVDQQIWNLTDHYVIQSENEEDILDVLLLTLAISAIRKDELTAASSSASRAS